jgi:glycerol-3-phosphate dehydrogenase
MEVCLATIGYRYFQQIFELNFKWDLKKENFSLVKESVEERDIVINNAPHMTRYLALCVPSPNILVACYYYVVFLSYPSGRTVDVPPP